jgi:hypothetical protein
MSTAEKEAREKYTYREYMIGANVIAIGEYVSTEYHKNSDLYFTSTSKVKVSEILMGDYFFENPPEFLFIRERHRGYMGSRDVPTEKGQFLIFLSKKVLFDIINTMKKVYTSEKYKNLYKTSFQQDIYVDPKILVSKKIFSIKNDSIFTWDNKYQGRLDEGREDILNISTLLDRKNFYKGGNFDK